MSRFLWVFTTCQERICLSSFFFWVLENLCFLPANQARYQHSCRTLSNSNWLNPGHGKRLHSFRLRNGFLYCSASTYVCYMFLAFNTIFHVELANCDVALTPSFSLPTVYPYQRKRKILHPPHKKCPFSLFKSLLTTKTALKYWELVVSYCGLVFQFFVILPLFASDSKVGKVKKVRPLMLVFFWRDSDMSVKHPFVYMHVSMKTCIRSLGQPRLQPLSRVVTWTSQKTSFHRIHVKF